MKIYLASPFFNPTELAVYRNVIGDLRSNDVHSVYVPQEHEIPNAWDMSNEEWARQVFCADIEAIEDCDVVMVLNFGMYSDSGTAWEAGYAMGLGKVVVQVLCGDENTVYSLMMFNGCSKVINLCDVEHWDKVSSVKKDKVIQK